MKQQIRKERITKVEFHAAGGFDNPQLFRLQSRGGAWRYYRRVDGVPEGTTMIVIDPISEMARKLDENA